MRNHGARCNHLVVGSNPTPGAAIVFSMKMEIPDLTRLSWPFNVALIGAVFAIFSLMYDTYFIYYGFFTVVYGILCHLFDLMYGFWLKEKKWGTGFTFLSQGIATILWVLTLICFYR